MEVKYQHTAEHVSFTTGRPSFEIAETLNP